MSFTPLHDAYSSAQDKLFGDMRNVPVPPSSPSGTPGYSNLLEEGNQIDIIPDYAPEDASATDVLRRGYMGRLGIPSIIAFGFGFVAIVALATFAVLSHFSFWDAVLGMLLAGISIFCGITSTVSAFVGQYLGRKYREQVAHVPSSWLESFLGMFACAEIAVTLLAVAFLMNL